MISAGKNGKNKGKNGNGNGKKIGRPRKSINWTKIDLLCKIQCTEEEIASVMECSIKTLQRSCSSKHGIPFVQYMRQKGDGGKSSLRRAQFKKAFRGDPALLIWLGKQYLEQTELVHHVGLKKMYDIGGDKELLEAMEAV